MLHGQLNLLHILLFQIMQTIGFLGPAFFLTQLSHIDSPAMAVLCMTCSQVWLLHMEREKIYI